MPDWTDEPILTPRFERAFRLAADLHRSHCRNSTTVPYLSHLMSVASLVLEDGGDEDEAIAALLHDALEDCADRIDPGEIETAFGARVRSLVEACTDTPPEFAGGPKPAWRVRKEAYVAGVAQGHGNRVSLADKLHNARSILRDHRADPQGIWDRFSVAKEETLWYYGALVRAYRDAGMDGFLVEELERVVGELEEREDGSGPEDADAEEASIGCDRCWPSDADAAWEAGRHLPREATLVDRSHFDVEILRCPDCGQKFVKVFTEMIDWIDGDDPQFSTRLPLTPGEASDLMERGESVSETDLLVFRRGRPFLARDFPKGASSPICSWKSLS